MKYGRLTLVEGSEFFDGRYKKVKVICDCGKEKVCILSNLTAKVRPIRSCGCIMKTRDHGHTCNGVASPTYIVWANMIKRCTNPSGKQIRIYFGISVCSQWFKFNNFLKDMGVRPEGLTLDRIDSTGNYEISNCRWADRHTQAVNRAYVVKYVYRGEVLCSSDWAKKLSIHKDTMRKYLKLHDFDIDKTIEFIETRYKPRKPRNNVYY